jgi:hypothetical protein
MPALIATIIDFLPPIIALLFEVSISFFLCSTGTGAMRRPSIGTNFALDYFRAGNSGHIFQGSPQVSGIRVPTRTAPYRSCISPARGTIRLVTIKPLSCIQVQAQSDSLFASSIRGIKWVWVGGRGSKIQMILSSTTIE